MKCPAKIVGCPLHHNHPPVSSTDRKSRGGGGLHIIPWHGSGHLRGSHFYNAEYWDLSLEIFSILVTCANANKMFNKGMKWEAHLIIRVDEVLSRCYTII